MLSSSTALVVLNALLVSALVVVVMTDVRSRRVPNVVVAPVALAGLCVAAASGGWGGLGESFGGLMVGMALLMPVWLAGGTGAGDVKLAGMVGALRGVEFAIFTVLFGAIAGGVMALLALAVRGGMREVLGNVAAYLQRVALFGMSGPIEATRKSFRMSYALAIALGAASAALYLQ